MSVTTPTAAAEDHCVYLEASCGHEFRFGPDDPVPPESIICPVHGTRVSLWAQRLSPIGRDVLDAPMNEGALRA